VPEHLLDDLDVGATSDRQACGGVPELVRIQVRDPDGSGGRTERRAERADPQRLAVADAGEDQVVRLPVGDVAGELGREEARDRNLAPLVGLGFPTPVPDPGPG
jgi:hypothetical protein